MALLIYEKNILIRLKTTVGQILSADWQKKKLFLKYVEKIIAENESNGESS